MASTPGGALGAKTTPRLRLRRPHSADAAAIFDTYGSDPDVTRYLGWPRHMRVEDTRAFVLFSDNQWKRWGQGPLLIEELTSRRIIGSTGLAVEAAHRASTGIVLAKAYWGQGYATEALAAVLDIARATSLCRVEALCHHAHSASARALEKVGFELEGRLKRHTVFPNLDPHHPQDVLLYAVVT